MTKYTTRPLSVEAHQFRNEQLKDLPKWLWEYEDYSPLGGKSPVARTPVGNLLIPTPDKSIEVYAGDWVVFDGKKIAKYKDAEFKDRFEPVAEGTPATAEIVQTPPPAAVEPPAPAPVAEAAPTPSEPAQAPVSEPAAQTGTDGDVGAS